MAYSFASVALLAVLLLVPTTTTVVRAVNQKGIVQLDQMTFWKVINEKNIVLMKYDRYYPFGETWEAYKKVAESVGRMSPEKAPFIIAHIGIEDFGEMWNTQFVKDLGISTNKDNFPIIKLYKYGFNNSVDFKRRCTTENLMELLRVELGTWFGLFGCLERFDKLARSFINDAKADKAAIIETVTKEAAELQGDNATSAQYYLQVMKKVQDKGAAVAVEAEGERIQKILDGKIGEAKREELQIKHNILQSFKKYRIKKSAADAEL